MTEVRTKLTMLAVAPSSTVRTLTSRSSPPKGTFTHRENLDSTLPAPQAELNHLTDHAVARNNETVEVGPRSQLKIIEPVSGPRSRPEEVSPRYCCPMNTWIQ